MNKYKILCIDDDKDILEIYEVMLEEHYTILKASNPIEAYKLLKENQNEIIYIFSDYNMPEKNGLELRQEILDAGYDIPCSIITGNYDIGMATKGMSLKISTFIEKPISENDLLFAVRDQGEKRRIQLIEEKEMVCSFISESAPMLEEIEGLILILEENPNDSNAINTYFRLLHTIKGTASCVGLKSLPKFTHSYEDLVSMAKEHKIAITPIFVDSLLFGLDRLKYMYDEITQNNIFEFEIQDWITKLNSFKEQKDSAEENIHHDKNIDLHENKKNQVEKLAIPIDTLDSFLELSGKLTIIRNTIYKAISRVEIKYANDKDIEVLSSSIEELHKITSMLQKDISEMRKIGAENITRPLKRVVRDTSKDLAKNVELKVYNEAIKIDNNVAKIISNCLVHLIRNSIDHGIELPEKRINQNKNDQGTIELYFSEEGENNIVILKDDGAGINKKRILEKAIEKQMILASNVSSMSNSEIFALIFESGFSTSQEVSSISGRGVGMDMVRSSIESIGGKIQIDSTEGLGTSFTLTLPQPKSVLINKTLMIEENQKTYSIPIGDVLEVVKVSREHFKDSIFNVANFPILKRYEEIIPILKLESCLNSLDHNFSDLRLDIKEELLTIIIKHGNSKVGIIVDKVHDIEESVIRKIKPVLNTSNIYHGVTYFGDDDLALVLNTENITRENIKTINRAISESAVHNKKTLQTSTKTSNEYFTFLAGNNHYGIDKEKVFRIEIINTKNIEHFCGNYFVNYRESIIKIIAINSSSLDKIKDIDSANVILIRNNDSFYGLYIDEFYEFIISNYEMETHFSKDTATKGTIIFEDQLIYIVDDIYLDQKILSLQDLEPEDKIESNIKKIDLLNFKLAKEAA